MRDVRELDRLDPWLDDGNIVLAVEEKSFRVHRSILRSYSEVFKDMFDVARPDGVEEEEVVDGCPVLRLQDAAEDVQIVLKALYDRSFVFFDDSPMPVTVLVAFLRLGKKYAIRQLFEEAKKRISFTLHPLAHASTMSALGNTILFPRISGNDPFNFRIMNIANEVGMFSPLVVAAFYCCVACPTFSVVDGYGSDGARYTLSSSNQRLVFLGQSYLAEVQRQLFRIMSHQSSSCENRLSAQNPCKIGIVNALRSSHDMRSPFAPWVHKWDSGICTACRQELRRKHEEARTRLWDILPAGLGLGAWKDLDKDAVVS